MGESPRLKRWGFNKLGELYRKGDGEKEKKKLVRKLEKITKKIGATINTFPKVSICVLNNEGTIVYCNRLLNRDMLEFISTYVKRNHDIFPDGSYAIPRSDTSLVIWKLSEHAAIVIHTEGGVGALLSVTPYIMRFSKKISEIVVKLSAFPREDFLKLYVDSDADYIFWYDVFSFVGDNEGHKSEKFLEMFGEKGVKVLEEMDGRKNVKEISEKTGISLEVVKEIIRQGLHQNLVKKVQQYPLVKRLDKGSLLLFGIDPAYTNFYRNLRRLCNGKRTLEEVASILEVPESKLVNILERIGKYVEWIRKVE
ncbi:MAG: hypothetical protein Q6352_013225 [Candidatus Freyrarchaeum guaymaensis]